MKGTEFKKMVNTPLLIKRVVLLSWITIAYNLVEGLVSIYFGVSDESVSLAGFGVQSLIELASAALVLWRFRGEVGIHSKLAEGRERKATFTIGILFLAIAILIAGASARQFLKGLAPETTLPGTIIAIISSSIMLYLWRVKRTLGRELESATVLSDAGCTLACFKISMVLLVGSCAFLFFKSLWWVDSAAAIGLTFLIGKEGRETIEASRSENFAGGCCEH